MNAHFTAAVTISVEPPHDIRVKKYILCFVRASKKSIARQKNLDSKLGNLFSLEQFSVLYGFKTFIYAGLLISLNMSVKVKRQFRLKLTTHRFSH